MRTVEVVLKPGDKTHINPHNYRNHEGVIQVSRDYGDTWYNLNQNYVTSDSLRYAIIARSE